MPDSLFRGPVLAFPGSSSRRTATPEFPFGTRGCFDGDGREHVYIQASGAIATGAPISVSASYVAGSGTNPYGRATQSADAKGFAGVAEYAFAATQCGFVVERGPCVALVPSGVAVGDPLTAGNGALSSTLTNAVRFAVAVEAGVLLSGTTQLKQVVIM